MARKSDVIPPTNLYIVYYKTRERGRERERESCLVTTVIAVLQYSS